MKLIIDIDDKIYTGLKDALNLRIVYMSRDDKERLLGAIANGIPYVNKIEQIREDVSQILRREEE